MMTDGMNLQSSIDGLEQKLVDSKTRQKKLRNWSIVMNIVIIAIFVIYGLVFYNIGKNNFSEEKLAKTLQSSMTQITPMIADTTMTVITDVAPVYMEAAAEKSETFMPQLAMALEKQSNKFVQNMTAHAEEELKKRLERIANGVADEFRKQYPDLTDEQLDRFITETEEDVLMLFTDLSQHILDESLPEIVEMKIMTENLPHEFLPEEELELYRLFIHKLLLLLDKEIMEG
jgi:hypothetical protein